MCCIIRKIRLCNDYHPEEHDEEGLPIYWSAHFPGPDEAPTISIMKCYAYIVNRTHEHNYVTVEDHLVERNCTDEDWEGEEYIWKWQFNLSNGRMRSISALWVDAMYMQWYSKLLAEISFQIQRPASYETWPVLVITEGDE